MSGGLIDVSRRDNVTLVKNGNGAKGSWKVGQAVIGQMDRYELRIWIYPKEAMEVWCTYRWHLWQACLVSRLGHVYATRQEMDTVDEDDDDICYVMMCYYY